MHKDEDGLDLPFQLREAVLFHTGQCNVLSVIDVEDPVEAPIEDRATLRLRQAYLVVLIACAIVEAGIMADVASGGQLRRDLEHQWERARDNWRRRKDFEASVSWMQWQAAEIIRTAR